MIAELFVLGSLLFWAPIVIAAVAIAVAVESDHVGWATFFVVALAALLWLFGNVDPVVQWVKQRTLWDLVWVGVYFAVGSIYTVPRLWWYVRKLKREYDRDVARYGAQAVSSRKPTVDGNKSRIIGWIIYWPLSMAWFLFNDPAYRLAEFIYERFGSIYQRIIDKVWEG